MYFTFGMCTFKSCDFITNTYWKMSSLLLEKINETLVKHLPEFIKWLCRYLPDFGTQESKTPKDVFLGLSKETRERPRMKRPKGGSIAWLVEGWEHKR